MGGVRLSCTYPQFQIVVPPNGQDCAAYLSEFAARSGGYSEVLPDGSCGYCTYASGDAYLTTLNMSTSPASSPLLLA